MKAFNSCVTVILFVATLTQPIQAETNLQITYKYEYLKAFALRLEYLQNQPHTIRLEDEHGFGLIREEINGQAQFGRMYNLEALPEGEYTMLIENEQQIIRQPIIVSRRFLTIDLTAQKEILKPAITIKTDLIDINMLHFEKEVILITLASIEGETVYTHAFKSFGSLNKRLNISQLKAGKYVIAIKTNAYEVKQNFTKGVIPVLMAGKF